MAAYSLAAAFLAGLAGFASPCVLPLIPAYLSYLGGVSAGGSDGGRMRIFANTLAFVLGLAVALSALGFALGALLQYLTGDMLLLASRISGAAIILFGLYILGFVRVGFFDNRHGLQLPQKASLFASLFIGMLFGVVWTPVMGAFLAFVIALAVSSPAEAPLLLFAYACGLGLPFIIAGAFVSQASGFIKKHGKAMAVFDRAMGLLVVLIGALIMLA
ncbi:cytochrome c biogenesis protein CcdA [Candidatus Micrarchaeota archaeon]|nr:cytochrome c biogenesis protein CcdA [Candidatus Micrarchaeota archaeon]